MKAGGVLGKLSPREQKLLGVLGVVVGLFVLLGAPALVYGSVSAARSTNEEIRKVLGEMARSRELLSERKRVRDAVLMRYTRKAPALASFIEKAATENGLEVPESKDRPDVPHGKTHVEHVTAIKLRKVGLLPLVKVLERIRRSGYPLAVSRLDIKKRAGEPDTYDVELWVSAFERKETEPDKAKARPERSAATSQPTPVGPETSTSVDVDENESEDETP